jgi:hypothetical protein
MNRLKLGISSAVLIFTFVFAVSLAHGQITPSGDSYTEYPEGFGTGGASPTLYVMDIPATQHSLAEIMTPYIQFNLSSIPTGYTSANIAKATLKLYVNSVAAPGSFNVEYVDGAWSEATIAYDNAPPLGATIASNVSLTTASVNDYILIDITSAVQAWLNGTQANDGIALVANPQLSATFDSKENTTTSHPAELDIVFVNGGAKGPAGPQGPDGPQGPQGPIGLDGPQGPAGPAGINNRGTWSSTTAYNVNDSVGYAGSSWIALAANTNSTPNASNSNWQVLAAPGINNQGSWVSTTNYQIGDAVSDGGQFWLAVAPNLNYEPSLLNPNWQLIAASGAAGSAGAAGPAGAAGAAGAQGPSGPMGLTGPQGAAGPQGPPPTFAGTWSNTATYSLGNAVFYNGTSYVSLIDSNAGNEPDTSPTQWAVLAQQGSAGAAGAQGPAGAAGAAGPQGAVGLPGATGATGATGPQGLIGPMGLTGATGAAGTQGPPATFAGTWSSATTYSLGTAVFYNGSGYVSLTANNVGNEPDTNPTQWALLAQQGAVGAAGAQGPAGAAGPAGPQGATGLQGATGATGATGLQGPIGPTGLTGITGATGPQGPAGTSAGATRAALLQWYSQNFSLGGGDLYPYGMAFDGTNIWVANFQGSGTVVELSASTGAVVGSYSAGSGPRALAFDGTNIWVANFYSNSVTKIPINNPSGATPYNVGTAPIALAFDGTYIWVANLNSNNVTKLLASTGTQASGSPYAVGNNPDALAFDGTNIWVANDDSNNVTKLLASTGVQASGSPYAVGSGPDGLAFDGSNIWVANSASNNVTELVASSGAQVSGSPYSAGNGPSSLAFDGTNIWVSGTLSVIRLASNGAVVGTYPVSGNAVGLAFDGANIWVSVYGQGTVTRIPD